MIFLKSDILKKYEKKFIENNSNNNTDDFDFFELKNNNSNCLVICPNSLTHFSADGTPVRAHKFIGTFSSVFSDCSNFNLLTPIKSFYDSSFIDFFNLHINKISEKENISLLIEFSSEQNPIYDISFEHCFDIDISKFYLPSEYSFSFNKISSPYPSSGFNYLKINLNEKIIDINNVNQFNYVLNIIIDLISSIDF